jgi:hypothetical protein
MPTEFFALGFAQQMHSEGEGMDPDEKWKRELNRWEKVSPAISEVHCKKGSIFQLSVVKKFPYLRRSGDEEMTGKNSGIMGKFRPRE